MVWLVHCFLPFSFSHIVSPPFATKHSNLYLIWLVEPRERTPSEPHKESYSITTNTRITLYQTRNRSSNGCADSPDGHAALLGPNYYVTRYSQKKKTR